MRFVSAQQDNKYCIWQLYVQLANFRRLGIEKDAVILFGYQGATESGYVDVLRRQTSATVISYPDAREQKTYTPSIYFHLVSKFLRQTGIKEPIFFHDGDIIFRELPNFDALVNDDVNYMSDTSNYMSPNLFDHNDFAMMAEHINIPINVPIDHKVTGGAQYLFKNHDWKFWADLEDTSTNLNTLMNSKEFNENPRTKTKPDPWMAGMWAMLWRGWDAGMKIEVTPEFAFGWPTYTAQTWGENKLLHNAGVMEHHADKMFHKGSYADRSPFSADLSHVSNQFASYYYAEEVKRAADIFFPGF